jgi:transporter family-2 protein
MKTPLLLLSVFFGVILTVHLAMNGAVGEALKNPKVGNALFWSIGAVTALIIGFSGWQAGALAPLKNVNPIMLTAGMMGASLVFGIAWIIPQVGAGPFTVMLLLGQLLSAMVISHFGWLGSPVHPISATGAAGAVLLFLGAYLSTRG